MPRKDVRLEDAPEPVCGPDEVKLRVRNCSTCGTDVKIFNNGHQNLSPPRIIGHEVAGEVVEVGANVPGWAPGDRAQVIAAVPCGECYECRRGWMAVCENQTSVGYQYDGGFAEYLIVPRQVLKVDGLNRIPDNIGFDEASVAEPFACAINAQELVKVGDGDTVVVFGAGPIGCLHIRLARANGASRVFLIDVNVDRLKMSADAVRPDEVINGGEVDVVERVMELTDGRGADVVITATAANVAQEQAIRDGRPTRPDLLLRWPAQDQPVHLLRLEPGALPGIDDHGRQRIGPVAQQAGAGIHRQRRGTGERSDHRAPPAGTRAGSLRHRRKGRGHQGHRRTLRCAGELPVVGEITE